MKTSHRSTLVSASSGLLRLKSRITTMSFSPKSSHIVVGTSDKVIFIYDRTGETIDEFTIKVNADVSHKSVSIRTVRFCPDERFQKIAIVQSDFIVSIFKWSTRRNTDVDFKSEYFKGKKSICNRFIETSSVLFLVWPKGRPFEVVYGLFDGTVKIGYLKRNESKIIYKVDSVITALSSHQDGNSIISAHTDGNIYLYSFNGGKRESTSCTKVIHHPCTVSTAALGRSIFVGDIETRFEFYTQQGVKENTTFHCKSESNEIIEKRILSRDITAVSFNGSGECIALGCVNCFYVYKWIPSTESWEQQLFEKVGNILSITAIDWSPDGSLIAIGSASGLVNLYNVCQRQYIYKTNFEVTHISNSQMMVRDRSNNVMDPYHFQANGGREIINLNIYPEPGRDNDRYIVAHTKESIILCDMSSPDLPPSEFEWKGNMKNERYIFDALNACIIIYAGELSVIEFGSNDILGTVRTEFTSNHLLSLRIGDFKHNCETEKEKIKKIACLLDQQTISVKNLITSSSTTFSHNEHIDFLELNVRGTMLIFRDKKRTLHVFDVTLKTRKTLLTSCSYAQWVPDSDVIVAQRLKTMFVWYNARALDEISSREIDGDIYGIEKVSGRTEVLVTNQSCSVSYLLSENLIHFGYALEDGNFGHAAKLMEIMDESSHSKTMWKQLFDKSLIHWNFPVAERCAAAFCDMSQARYIRNMYKTAKKFQDHGVRIQNIWAVQVLWYKLRRNLNEAEDVYVSNNKIDDAVEMYEELMKFSEALRLLETYESPHTNEKKTAYMDWLLKTNQDEKAAKLREQEGDFEQAMHLYLNARLPGKAASIIFGNNIIEPTQLLQSICLTLKESGSYKKAGKIYHKLEHHEDALKCYLRGHLYQEAIELARKHFPVQVTSLEEKWGNYLSSIADHAAAIEHYMEAHLYQKAVESAIYAKKWEEAADIAENSNDGSFGSCLEFIADYFRDTDDMERAETFYLKSKQYTSLVSMYLEKDRLDNASRIAKSFLSENERKKLYHNQAKRMEECGKFKIAEKMLEYINDPESGIHMYIRNKHYESAVKLAKKCNSKQIKQTNICIANKLEHEGNLQEAEKYYCATGDWTSAMTMYQKNNLWDEALRVATNQSDSNLIQRVAYEYALYLGPSACDTLGKTSYLHEVVQYASDKNDFNLALDLARHENSTITREEIHFKRASYLESKENFTGAEKEYTNASKPECAVKMYMRINAWDKAEKIAVKKCCSLVPLIHVSHAKVASENQDYSLAEKLFIKGENPLMALSMYRKLEMWGDTKRIARIHLPHLLDEVNSLCEKMSLHGGEIITTIGDLNSGQLHSQVKPISSNINSYLSMIFDKHRDISISEKVKNQILDYVKIKEPQSYDGVLELITSKLCQLGKYEEASEFFSRSNKVDEAVETLIVGKCWTKAKELAQSRSDLSRRVKIALSKQALAEEDNTLATSSENHHYELDAFTKAKDWDGLWKHINGRRYLQSRELVEQYINMQFEDMMKSKDYLALTNLVNVLSNEFVPCLDYNSNLHLYLELTIGILSLSKEEEDSLDLISLTGKMKRILQRNSENGPYYGNEQDSMSNKFDHLLMAVHYTHMMLHFQKHGLFAMATKCAITLLRYSSIKKEDGTKTSIIPSDKVFYNAGSQCKKSRHTQLSFLFLNRYIDIIEAIEDEDSSSIILNDEFSLTVAFDNWKIPSKQYLASKSQQDQIRDWVLSMCMDSNIQRSLPDKNSIIDGSIYSGLYESSLERCILTGYPIPMVDELTKNNFRVHKRDWGEYVKKFKQCPWTGAIL